MFEFVPQDILPRLSKGRPYTMLILKKGANYNNETSRKIIQSEHLPHLFKQQDEGVMCFSMPVMDNTDIAGIAVYALTDKEQVKNYVEADPAVRANIFSYELLSSMGLQGDSLQ